MMSHNDKKQLWQSVSTDRLSNLPGNVIDDILVRLPLQDAVRTSILSKQWRYKWCSLTQLDLANLRLKHDSIPLEVKLKNIIDHLFTRHSGPINKFALCFPSCLIPSIDNLIHLLSGNGIQHMDLGVWYGDEPYKLPSHFFTCLQLRHLTLLNCLIELPPPAFKGFDRLICLELYRVEISSKTLENLICNCCLLEQLVLEISGISDIVEIKAPMLKLFDFSGSIRRIWLKHCPRLAKLSLKDDDCSLETGKCDIAMFAESSSVLKHLQLNGYSLKLFAAGGMLTRPPFDFNSVRCLCLSNINLNELNVVSCAFCMIKSCPYVQYMEIEAECDYEYNEDDYLDADDIREVGSLDVGDYSDVTFSHLREVKLGGDIATMPGIQLTKLLLAKAPMLVTMLINPWINEDNRQQFTVTLDRAEVMGSVVNEFVRASPKVKVVYNIEYNPDCDFIYEL